MLVLGREIGGDRLGAFITFSIPALASMSVGVASHYGYEIAPWVWTTYTAICAVCGIAFFAFLLHIGWVGTREWGASFLSRLAALVVCVFGMVLALAIFLEWGLVKKSDAASAPPAKQAPIDPNKLTPILAVDGVKGQDLQGQILLRNDTNQNVILLGWRYKTFGVRDWGGSSPQTIPQNQSYPIIIEPQNGLLKTGRLEIRYDFKFAGEEATYKGYGNFTIPEVPQKGEVGPDRCCIADADAPLLSNFAATIGDKLLQPRGVYGFPMNDSNGVVSLGRVPFQHLYFDPIQRFVAMTSGPPGPDQVIRLSGMRSVPSGDHWLEVRWDESMKIYELFVDGCRAQHLTRAELDAGARRKQQCSVRPSQRQ
jgi:hypothetical protein